jgi:hypothetical protein
VRQEIDGRPAWVLEGGSVVVVPRDDAVFTLVGGPSDVAVSDLPQSADYTAADRIRLSAEGMLRRLGIE